MIICFTCQQEPLGVEYYYIKIIVNLEEFINEVVTNANI